MTGKASERASERDAVIRYLRAIAYTFEPEPNDVLMHAASEIESEAHAEFRVETSGDFELVDYLVIAKHLDAREALTTERDALRAILLPLLDDPWRYSDGPRGLEGECVFCGDVSNQHDSDCAVLRRDELLGQP